MLARQPSVDQLTLSLFNRKVLIRADFDFRRAGEVRLKEQSLKRYLEYYEPTMTTSFHSGRDGPSMTFQDWPQDQAEKLRKSVLDGRARAPVVLEL